MTDEPYDPDIDDIPAEEWELDPAYADLPDLDAERPPRPDESHFQDDITEGLGGKIRRAMRAVFPTAPRGWKAAIETAAGYARSGKYVDAGMCLRETRQYYGVASRYAAAVDSMNSAGSKRMLRSLKDGKAPRGAIVYAKGGGSQYGHVWISVGGGWSISTDWPTNRYGRVRITTLVSSWGYTEVKWSPLVNDVRVWPRKDLYGGGGGGNGGDGKDPETVKRNDVPGWWVVRTTLNGRKSPSTRAKATKVKRRGAKVKVTKAVHHEGRLWVRSDKGTWYAAGPKFHAEYIVPRERKLKPITK